VQTFKRTYEDDKFFDVADQLSWCDLCKELPVCVMFSDPLERDAFDELKVSQLFPGERRVDVLLVSIHPRGWNLNEMTDRIVNYNPRRIYIANAGGFTSDTFDRIKQKFNDILFVYGKVYDLNSEL